MAGPCDVPLVALGCDLAGAAGGLVGSAAGSVASAGFDAAARSMGDGADELLRLTTSAWVAVPSSAGAQKETVQWLQGDLLQVTLFVAVIGFIVGGAKTALSHRTDDLRLAFFGAFRLLTVTAAGGVFLYSILRLGDDFSQWIINDSMGGTLDTSNIFSFAKAGAVSSGIVLVLGFLAIVGAIVQIGLLLVRSALLVLLAGVWPLSAAASMTAWGEDMWKKITGWLVAFALYKPAAAVIYATAFRLIRGGGSADAGEQLLALVEGVVLLFVAIMALPALLRLIVPAASALGNASAGGAIAAGAVLATGAIAVPALAGGMPRTMPAGATNGFGGGASGSNGGGSGFQPPSGGSGPSGGSSGGSGGSGSKQPAGTNGSGGNGPGSGGPSGSGPSGTSPAGTPPGVPRPQGAPGGGGGRTGSTPTPTAPNGPRPSGAGSGAAGYATGAARGAEGLVDGDDRS